VSAEASFPLTTGDRAEQLRGPWAGWRWLPHQNLSIAVVDRVFQG